MYCSQKKYQRTQTPKILVYESAPGFGGSITSLAALVPELESAGFKVVVVALHEERWESQGLADKMIFMQTKRWEDRYGYRFFYKEFLRYIELRKITQECQADIVLGNNTPLANLAACWVSGSLGLPYYQYIRGKFHPSRIAGYALSQSEEIYLVGEEVERLFNETPKATVPRAMQIPEGLAAFQWPTPRTQSSKNWFWSSALAEWKGLPFLTEAYDTLQQTGLKLPPLNVCYASFSALDDDSGALPKTIPLGVTLKNDPPNMDQIRSESAVYFHTALRPEPFGRSIIETMAAGLCPVVPNEGGGIKLVKHMENGLVYEARSLTGLVDAMKTVATEPQLVDALGKKAAATAEQYRAAKAFSPIIQHLQRHKS